MVNLYSSKNKIIITPGFVEMGDKQYDLNFEFGCLIAENFQKCIVVNKVKASLMNAGLIPSLTSIVNSFKSPVVGVIQDDDNIHISTNKGIPIVWKKGTYIEHNFKDIVSRII
jgi:septum site-determining protein MinD